MRWKGCLLAALLAAAVVRPGSARADIKPSPLFSEGMVLQQGGKAPVWGTADPGETVRLQFEVKSGGTETSITAEIKADKSGLWRLDLDLGKGVPAGGPYTLTFKGKNEIVLKEVYVGEVWVCSGQSNMEMKLRDCAGGAEAIANSKNPKIRLFTVQRTRAKEPLTTLGVGKDPKEQYGKWLECDPATVADFSGVAYFFGRDLQKALGVPVGLIHTSWGGTASEEWTSRKVLDANPMHKGKTGNETTLYNGMIAPLIPFAIKGVIWYQGESNAGRAELYRTGFPLMIKNWRDDWGAGDFPFLFVQIAPWVPGGKKPTDTNWAPLRDAQLHTMKTVKNTAMAVITDVGDPKDIHPKRKEAVGARLALAAEALAYGKNIEYSGPVFEKMTIEGDKAVLTFSHAGKGLELRKSSGEGLVGFEIAGEDGKYYPAQAAVKGDTVVVSSDKVSKPVAVRYGWANMPDPLLWNQEGLPASPFRTDEGK